MLSFRVVFFYIETTGWIFGVSLCENSINSINQCLGRGPSFEGSRPFLSTPNFGMVFEMFDRTDRNMRKFLTELITFFDKMDNLMDKTTKVFLLGTVDNFNLKGQQQ